MHLWTEDNPLGFGAVHVLSNQFTGVVVLSNKYKTKLSKNCTFIPY